MQLCSFGLCDLDVQFTGSVNVFHGGSSGSPQQHASTRYRLHNHRRITRDHSNTGVLHITE
jgi:hypothetical protein